MEILLMMIYAAICIAVFKIFRIPINKWTLPTAVLGGIFLIGFILLVMNYNHPFSKNGRIYFATTPIMPDVKGRVIDVPVEANAPLNKGDVLFRIDPHPYEYEVEKRRAALAEAEQNVAQLKAGYDSAQASVEEATAQRDRAKGSYDRYRQGNDNAKAAGRDLPFSIADVENRRTTYLAAEGTLKEATAKAEQARVAYQSQIGGVHTSVARLRADLQDAEWDLENTTVHAPGPGFVTQVALRPGMFVIPAPLRPVMVFVNTGDRDWSLAAGFQQNALQRVRDGDEAEVAFEAVPGHIFKGRVKHVLDAIALGQLQATGSLQDMGEPLPGGRAVAIIELTDDTKGYNIPGGAAAEVALYTPYWHHFSIIRKILLRMRSWENYVFLEGH
jgi:multidrug resistance efflux pump